LGKQRQNHQHACVRMTSTIITALQRGFDDPVAASQFCQQKVTSEFNSWDERHPNANHQTRLVCDVHF
jgi:hypothetical protein